MTSQEPKPGNACRHFGTCGLTALDGEDCCILHSASSEKNPDEFKTAMYKHRDKKGFTFRNFIFPIPISFDNETITREFDLSDAEFREPATFLNATFKSGRARFAGAKFFRGATFKLAKFPEGVSFTSCQFETGKGGNIDFSEVTFEGRTSFRETIFKSGASFHLSTFEFVDFEGATFEKDVSFHDCRFDGDCVFRAKFVGGARFELAKFSGEADFASSAFESTAIFTKSQFRSRAIFAPVRDEVLFIRCPEVRFNSVILDRSDLTVFRDANLTKASLLHTDVTKVFFSSVTWPKRFVLWDDAKTANEKMRRPHGALEQLYRQLKVNYQSRGDYPGGGGFHYNEKKLRRESLSPRKGDWWLLSLYKWLGGFGERALPPALWFFGVLCVAAGAYSVFGLVDDNGAMISWCGGVEDCLRALGYSLQVSFFSRPSDLKPAGFAGYMVQVVQSIVGPILLALLALVVRQKVKR